MSVQRLIQAASLIAIGIGLYLFQLWQPEPQIRKHSIHLTESVGHKNWQRFAGFIARDYQDQWGNDRSAVLEQCREVFERLRDIRINPIGQTVRFENGAGYWRAFMIVESPGQSELMTRIKTRINTLQTPFEFEWRRMSRKPWDWKLVAVRNPELNISFENEAKRLGAAFVQLTTTPHLIINKSGDLQSPAPDYRPGPVQPGGLSSGRVYLPSAVRNSVRAASTSLAVWLHNNKPRSRSAW